MKHNEVTHTTKTTRNKLIDNLFVLAMLVVIIGHSNMAGSQNTMWIFDWSNSFQMPMFFFLSGYLFKYTLVGEMSAGVFFKKKSIRLLIPLLVITTIGFLLKAAIGSNAGRPVELTLSAFINSFLYPRDNPVIFLWFLPVMFQIQTMMYGVCKAVNRWDNARYILFLTPLGPILYYTMPHTLFLGLSSMLLFTGYFICGMLFCFYHDKVMQMLHINSIKTLLISGAISITLPFFELPAFTDVISAISSIIFFICVMVRFDSHNIRFLPSLRRYSYTIYLLSWFPQSFCASILMPRLDPSLWPLVSIITFTTGLLCPYIFGLILDRLASKPGRIFYLLRLSFGLS